MELEQVSKSKVGARVGTGVVGTGVGTGVFVGTGVIVGVIVGAGVVGTGVVGTGVVGVGVGADVGTHRVFIRQSTPSVELPVPQSCQTPALSIANFVSLVPAIEPV